MRKITNEKEATSARRTWLTQAACLGIGLYPPVVGWATEPAKKKPTARGGTKTHYLVSAILREGVQDFSFRLVHSVQSAASVEEATGLLTRLVQEKYPGHAVAQTTVTDIVLPPGACTTAKTTGPRKPTPTLYIVSAVLSEGGGNHLDTMLVNGWLPGKNRDEALGRVLKDVKARYPSFAPASTLATELDLTLAGCPAPGPVRSFGERA